MSDRILIVDDEMPIRRLLRVSTERSGYATEEAATAAAALGALDRSRPRLVLLDLGLPDRDGLLFRGHLERAGLRFRERGRPLAAIGPAHRRCLLIFRRLP